MFKDKSHNNNFGDSGFDKNPVYIKLIAFVERHIADFPAYLKNVTGNIESENHITATLDDYLGDKVREEDLPYKFQNQAPDRYSNRITDIGVKFQSSEKGKFKTENKAFCWIEAKRLKTNSHGNEYVYGNTGGIERFKRSLHASGLPFSIMIAYIQREDSGYWVKRINENIDTLIKSNSDITIEWVAKDKLSANNTNLFECFHAKSSHSRVNKKPITLFHYWVNV